MTLVEVEINSVSLHEGIITIFGNDVSHSSSDRLERIRTDGTERNLNCSFRIFGSGQRNIDEGTFGKV